MTRSCQPATCAFYANYPYDHVPGECPLRGQAAWRRIKRVDVDPGKLTIILARRLAAIVPEGFHVQAADGVLWYSADEHRFPGQAGDYCAGTAGTYVRDNFAAHGREDEDRVVGAAAQALDELQDYISEATHDPWPGKIRQPNAHAQIRRQKLHLWYGGPGINDAVVLACESIRLADLRRSP